MEQLNPPGHLLIAHSIEGDFNFSSRAEVESLMGGSASGRVVR